MRYFLGVGQRDLHWNQLVAPWQWVHLCLLLGKDVALALDGKILEPSEDVGVAVLEKECDIAIPKKLGCEASKTPYNITVGYPDAFIQDLKLVQPFGGVFTLPQVYMRRLEGSELLALASCQQVSPEELPEEEAWQVLTKGFVRRGTILVNNTFGSRFVPLDGGAEGFLQLADVDEEDLCLPRTQHKHIFTTGRKMNYNETLSYCMAYGGSLPDATDQEEMRQVMKVGQVGWAGRVDGEGPL
ncbi:uncharacterized protein [Penaeus vannamei]|uniref:uncharacterized protein n=1 Tax=Penaeus vannamei TaxID=6689 RepID=UPI00387F54B6